MSPRQNQPLPAGGKLRPIASPAPQRRHRHKRFHVRPEARGYGYQTYGLWSRPAPPPVAPPRPAPVPVPPAAPTSGWQAFSERETGRRAAQNGLRILLLLILPGCFVALFPRYSLEVFHWLVASVLSFPRW